MWRNDVSGTPPVAPRRAWTAAAAVLVCGGGIAAAQAQAPVILPIHPPPDRPIIQHQCEADDENTTIETCRNAIRADRDGKKFLDNDIYSRNGTKEPPIIAEGRRSAEAALRHHLAVLRLLENRRGASHTGALLPRAPMSPAALSTRHTQYVGRSLFALERVCFG
jgi:hypothetical protein